MEENNETYLWIIIEYSVELIDTVNEPEAHIIA